MKCGVVTFPGSNCDRDCFHILSDIFGLDTQWVWHKETSLGAFDLVVLPGGFSFGDYLRPGSIAKFSPILKAVVAFAEGGGRVLGICNGFQILVESGLLPGALLDNQSQKFICRYLNVRVDNADTVFTGACEPGEVLRIPVAHAQGNYFADPDTLKRLEDENRIVFRYCDDKGELTDTANPNGSMSNIAGLINEGGNVMGMMPHPERCADPLWAEQDGRKIFQSLVEAAGAARS